MVLDERMDTNTETHDVQSHRARNPIRTPSRSDARLQVPQKVDFLEHRRCAASLEEQCSEACLELSERGLAQICQSKEIADAPEKDAGL